MGKLKFSGHESFICRQFWLPKGLNFVWNKGGNFNAKDAVVKLGVGKNMVASIRFWLKAFGMIDENDQPTPLADRLFGENGWDPYIEESGTVWLLHYKLVTTRYASIYNLVFNDFQTGRIQFTQERLQRFIVRKCAAEGNQTNPKSIERDISVFLRSYLQPGLSKRSDLEEEFTRLLISLKLLHSQIVQDAEEKKKYWYSIDKNLRDEIPWQVILFAILDQLDPESLSISFAQIYKMPDSPGLIFGMSEEGLQVKINEMASQIPEINYSETAGNRVLQFSRPLNKYEVLHGYYH